MCLTHYAPTGVSCILCVQIYQVCGCGKRKCSSQSSRCKDQSDLDTLLLYLPPLLRLLRCTCPWRQHSGTSDLVIFQGLNPVIKVCGRSWAKAHRSGTNRPHDPIKNERKLPKKSSPCCKFSMARLNICHKRLFLKLGLKCFSESLWCFKEYRCKPEFISFYSEDDLSLWQWNILQDMKGGVNLHALNKHIYVY